MRVFHLHHFNKKIDFGPPSKRFIFCTTPEVLNEIVVFGVLAISKQKSFFAHRYKGKSMFQKNDKFREAISLEPVQPRATFRPHLEGQNVAEKFRDCTGSSEGASWNLTFFEKSILHCTCRQKSTFGVKSRAHQKTSISVKNSRNNTKNTAELRRGDQNRFFQ